MRSISRLAILSLGVSMAAVSAVGAAVGAAERRVALVVGEASYPGRPLTTPSNDAGLVAQTLQDAGFEVMGARDLGKADLDASVGDFLGAVASGGPGAVAFVYLSGYGVQYRGDNYLAATDATLEGAGAIASQALDVSGLVRELARTGVASATVVLDAAHSNTFPVSGELAGGLGLEDAPPRMVVALSAAPGTVAPDWRATYGPYALALSQTIREGGLALGDMFVRVRERTDAASKGAQTPWSGVGDASGIALISRASDAPQVSDSRLATAIVTPMAELAPSDAYDVAIARDTLGGYDSFLGAYPDDAMSDRVRLLAAARRESLTWWVAVREGTSESLWSYLRRYPEGPHATGARVLLSELGQYALPPELDDRLAGVAPPGPGEAAIVGRLGLSTWGESVRLAPPPPIPSWVAPTYEEQEVPVPVYVGETYLPIIAAAALPAWVEHRRHDRSDRDRPSILPPALAAKAPPPARAAMPIPESVPAPNRLDPHKLINVPEPRRVENPLAPVKNEPTPTVRVPPVAPSSGVGEPQGQGLETGRILVPQERIIVPQPRLVTAPLPTSSAAREAAARAEPNHALTGPTERAVEPRPATAAPHAQQSAPAPQPVNAPELSRVPHDAPAPQPAYESEPTRVPHVAPAPQPTPVRQPAYAPDPPRVPQPAPVQPVNAPEPTRVPHVAPAPQSAPVRQPAYAPEPPRVPPPAPVQPTYAPEPPRVPPPAPVQQVAPSHQAAPVQPTGAPANQRGQQQNCRPGQVTC